MARLVLPHRRVLVPALCLGALAVKLPLVWAHPGAVADGRATCGLEYSTSDTAYEIPDISESWYLRRVATCESPVFWTKFEVTAANQHLYIATISPELERFEDELQFHAILYGPGVKADTANGLSEIPLSLPEEVVPEPALGAAGYATHTKFDACAFVDTNPVMKSFSDVIEGRCMEEFTLSDDFKDPLQQNTTSLSWWIYSYNHKAVDPGTYYLQTWLSTRNNTAAVAQGKYEMTLGPWIWYGYASKETLDVAQNQGTSCSCAMNALDYKENYLERLGDLDPAFEVAQLPGGSCGASAPPESPCVTIPREAYLSNESAVEWSGLWELEANRTYEWTFRAYYEGSKSNNSYGYPDPGMYVHIVPSKDVESASKTANDDLTRAVEKQGDSPLNVVAEGEMLDLESKVPQYVLFTNTSLANSTTVLIKVTSKTASSLAIFTQHVPSEFMAHVLRDAKSGEYVFPAQSTLYVEADEEPAVGAATDAPSKVDSAVERKTGDPVSGKKAEAVEAEAEPDMAATVTVTSGAGSKFQLISLGAFVRLVVCVCSL